MYRNFITLTNTASLQGQSPIFSVMLNLIQHLIHCQRLQVILRLRSVSKPAMTNRLDCFLLRTSQFAMTFLCLFLTTTCLTAQNTVNYKYILTSFDTEDAGNTDVLEVNNRYYLLTAGRNDDIPTIVTVYDEDLNTIEQIQLFAGETNFFSRKLFYEQDTFYIFGWKFSPDRNSWECFFAKFDKNFNLVQPITVLSDSEYYSADILKTKKNEFILQFCGDTDSNRLVHINNKGEILQDVITVAVKYGNTSSFGTILETDSNFIINFSKISKIGILKKDSLGKYIYKEVESRPKDFSDGRAIVVNNQIIRSSDVIANHEECPKDQFGFPVSEEDRSIAFLDNNFK